jgi:hypothetical protein
MISTRKTDWKTVVSQNTHVILTRLWLRPWVFRR